MTDPLLQSGSGEEFKAAVHLGMFGLAIACLGYNSLAYSQRKELHLLSNVMVYASLALYEIVQMDRHWRAVWR